MDRRQQKSRDAIFAAFSRLLEKKNYSHITVQEIIDEANIGRSTFYAHFETKDELLDTICRQIFGHIFSDVLNAEPNHDFSKENQTLSDKLTHLLYHLLEQKKEITSLLSGESGGLFLSYFKPFLRQLPKRSSHITRHLPDKYPFSKKQGCSLSGSFPQSCSLVAVYSSISSPSPHPQSARRCFRCECGTSQIRQTYLDRKPFHQLF